MKHQMRSVKRPRRLLVPITAFEFESFELRVRQGDEPQTFAAGSRLPERKSIPVGEPLAPPASFTVLLPIRYPKTRKCPS